MLTGIILQIVVTIFSVLFFAIRIYCWALILAAIISTLLSFGVLDRRNRAVWTIADFLYRVTEPALRPIRHYLPDLGGLDISPLLLLLLLQMVVQPLLAGLERGLVYGIWQPLN